MTGAFQRLALVMGPDAIQKLAASHVYVFGLGGVGSWCAEALVRSGIGRITIVDSDTICVTNINRQIEATERTIGLFKADVLKGRLQEINGACDITAVNAVYSAQNASLFNLEDAGYVIDAIDSLTCKLDLIEHAYRSGAVLYSCMGMAQKLDSTRIITADIWKTTGCPLARLVRQGLKKRNFDGHFTCVYSSERLPLQTEVPVSCGSTACLCPARRGDTGAVEWCSAKKVINGSAVTVTAAAGMALAGLVLQDIYRG